MGQSFSAGGVQLTLGNFKQYVAGLNRIEREHREAFSDKSFQGAARGFDKAEKSMKDYERQLQRTSRQQEKLNSAISGLGLAFGARELIQFGRESVDLFREQAKAEAQLAAAIRSTGGAAGVGSNQLRTYAAELQGLTNFGDEAIIQSESLLLTFTNIGRDVFPQAVKAILDVSTAMDQDLNQSAIQVGKALNDPIRGLGNLRDVGIQFTAAQEAQIKRFVEINDLASAQGVILQELNRQFGGSAEAAREADGGISALGNSFGDLQEQVGALIVDFDKSIGLTQSLTNNIDLLTGSLRGIRFDLGLSDDITDQLASTQAILNDLQLRKQQLEQGGPIDDFLEFIGLGGSADKRLELLNEQIQAFTQEAERLKGIAAAEDVEELAKAQVNAAAATMENVEANKELEKALQNSVRQAEQLALSFSRQAEDAARKFGRSQEKLGRDQAKARDKLLISQQKQLDEFEQGRLSAIAEAQDDILKEEARANRERERESERFRRQQRQAEERFNLDRIQSQRRFVLDETRLRASGDILGLQRLREDFDLTQQEQAENFDLQQKQSKENEAEQGKIQAEEQADRLAELQDDLDKQRQELLSGFDEQLANLEEAQREQREALLESYAEQAEDRLISQQRQLEDLGRSLAQQEDLTKEGAAAIAQQLEEAFGEAGVADQIMSGFTMRQESAFQNLFESITAGAKTTKEQLEALDVPVRDFGRPLVTTPGGRRLPGFAEGGVVPGPLGSPVPILAHAGETVLPTHKFNMPIAMPNRVDHVMSGGTTINVAGLEGASQATVERAVEAMIELQDVALKRILRRYGVS